ncbi:hypothetical protein Bca101_075362 [Brassica carinata]
MKSKPDLALDSSSIGDRVRSKKQRSGEVKNPSRVVVEAVSLAVEVDRFLLVGPLSTIEVEEVVNWREKYHLPDDVVIRIPGPIDRVSDFEVDEDPVSRACIWAQSSLGNPKYLFSPGPYSAFVGKTTTGTCSNFAFCRSEASTIEFLCCILLLKEVTNRLRGFWYGCKDPSAKLCCFPRLDKQRL